MTIAGHLRYENIHLNIAGHAHYEFSQVPSSFVTMHWHDAIELIYLLEGELLVETEQRKWHLKAGQCILLNPYVLHSTTSLSGNTALLLQIPVEELSFFTEEVRTRQFLWDPATTEAAALDAMGRVKKKLELMRETAESDNHFAHMRMASLLLEITYLLYTDFSQPVSGAAFTRSEKNRQRLTDIISFTEQHYREEISLQQVANALHLHPNYFCRFFKENTGTTYLNYLSEYRLSKIYHDLVTTDIPLSHLLEKHGFTNYKLFRQMFADRFHGTPGSLREEWRK